MFDRAKLAATIQAIYEEVRALQCLAVPQVERVRPRVARIHGLLIATLCGRWALQIGRVAMRSPRLRQAAQVAAAEQPVDESTEGAGPPEAGTSPSASSKLRNVASGDYSESEQLMQCAAVRADLAAQFMAETSVFRGWSHEALVELSWFGFIVDVEPSERVQPPAMFVRGGCLYFVMSGQVRLPACNR